MQEFPYQIKTNNQYFEDYRRSVEDPENFWASVAAHFVWKKKWDRVLEWDFVRGHTRWFEGAQLNITENCLDRHVATQSDVLALIWEPNDPGEPVRKMSYRELHAEVCRCAHMLRYLGIEKGDRVCIYMGMIPELVIAVLACARIGAVHSVVFGGFSAASIADRIEDAQARFLITCDGAFRGGKEIQLKAVVDEAIANKPSISKVLVYRRTHCPVSMQDGRDVWWHDLYEIFKSRQDFSAVTMEAEDPLFILYTSGSTGKPKGVVHSCAGYMIYAQYSFVNVFQYRKGQIHFCTADIGWITGHSYIVYGPLLSGATALMFEGIPTWPDAGRFWDIVDKHRVNILYTAPTAIRSLMSFGLGPLEGKKLDSLQVLGTVGEPINVEAWEWYFEHVGKRRCPIVDTWWQTETGGILISNLAGVTPYKPSYATLPLPGVQLVLMDDLGNIIPDSDSTLPSLPREMISGILCIKFPWPSILRTTYNDHERCVKNYFSAYPGFYFTGDGCLRDTDGSYRITGRVDDVINVSGHRIGTAEVENAIGGHPAVIESAVVGYQHPIKGQGIFAFIVASRTPIEESTLKGEIIQTVQTAIGPFAKPDRVQFVEALPKTRSGKIMRRILRKIVEGERENFGDTTSLLDPAVVGKIADGFKRSEA